MAGAGEIQYPPFYPSGFEERSDFKAFALMRDRIRPALESYLWFGEHENSRMPNKQSLGGTSVCSS